MANVWSTTLTGPIGSTTMSNGRRSMEEAPIHGLVRGHPGHLERGRATTRMGVPRPIKLLGLKSRMCNPIVIGICAARHLRGLTDLR